GDLPLRRPAGAERALPGEARHHQADDDQRDERQRQVAVVLEDSRLVGCHAPIIAADVPEAESGAALRATLCENRSHTVLGGIAPMTTSAQPTHREAPDRNLAMELVRVTESAAMAAGRWVGRGDKEGGDGAAVDAMRHMISSVSMHGVVVIGEGEKAEAPMLFNGEEVGNAAGPECDVAVDPIDGTTLMAKGMPNSIAVLACAERGAMSDPSAVFYR